MLLNQIAGKSNPPAKNSETAEFSERIQRNFEISDCRYERELAVGMAIVRDPAMRTPGTAGFGTGPQSLVDNGLQGARAPAAFGATTKTAIDLLGVTREIIRSADGVADIVVAEDVAGANNH
jgi:hypothetical protein